jgi:hypothetical protein
VDDGKQKIAPESSGTQTTKPPRKKAIIGSFGNTPMSNTFVLPSAPLAEKHADWVQADSESTDYADVEAMALANLV